MAGQTQADVPQVSREGQKDASAAAGLGGGARLPAAPPGLQVEVAAGQSAGLPLTSHVPYSVHYLGRVCAKNDALISDSSLPSHPPFFLARSRQW